MNYTNREVVRRIKQYDMFLNSLNITTDSVQKERICDQLDKIEKQILLETNNEYEQEYMSALEKESKFLEEEKDKLRELISIINTRREYLNERKKKHKKVTGSLVELTTFLGEDKLTIYKRNLKIIEKYEENKVIAENIIHDMKEIDVRISSASRNVKANARLNDMLENKMISLIERSLEKLDLFELVNKRDEIEKKYDSLKYILDMASDNLESAKSIEDNDAIIECNEMLSQISEEYNEYNEKINILKLIDTYENPVHGYDELLQKRNKINAILRSIEGSSLYEMINDELSKEYNTIKLEKQDIETYEALKEDREKKNKILADIEEENNSEEFKEVLEKLIKNEKKYRDEQVRKARMLENAERERKFLENKRIEESRVKRQKLIEDARLKDQQERAEKLKELQAKTAINLKNEEYVPKPKVEIKEEKMFNPLQNMTFEDMKVNDDFNSDELFEKTKIVPNKPISKENINDEIDKKIDFLNIDNSNELNEENNFSFLNNNIAEPRFENTDYLFKEEPKEERIEIPVEDSEEIKYEEPVEEITIEPEEEIVETPIEEPKEESIYDLLENNDDIIWQTINTANESGIPVIGNNNLKPEIMSKKNNEFPNIGNEGGEILWKETL